MKLSLEANGYSIHRAVASEDQLALFREEAERVTGAAGTSCVRHLRRRSGLFDELAHSGALLSLLPPEMIPVRSILFDKNEKENWSVAWHQDVTIAVTSRVEVDGYSPWSMKDSLPHVQPPSELLDNMVTIRLHLDDTPAENGALRVIPKSHLLGKIPTNEVAEHTQNHNVICECLAGDVLLMKPLILHSSRRSEFPRQRRVVHIEYARSGDLHLDLQWAEQSNK
jgi:ectoine hydroxylase-related dioxygenase (phytanoyl-CoA dioxygenase family)